MNIETIVHIISLILAPAVMISSCALFSNGVLQRYEAISARMRTMDHERLDLLRATGKSVTTALAALNDFDVERLHEIDEQLPSLLRRHRMIRNTLLTIDAAILILVMSMFIIAVAQVINSSLVALIALIIFLLGTAAFLLSVSITTIEVRQSHSEVCYEVERGLRLGK